MRYSLGGCVQDLWGLWWGDAVASHLQAFFTVPDIHGLSLITRIIRGLILINPERHNPG